MKCVFLQSIFLTQNSKIFTTKSAKNTKTSKSFSGVLRGANILIRTRIYPPAVTVTSGVNVGVAVSVGVDVTGSVFVGVGEMVAVGVATPPT